MALFHLVLVTVFIFSVESALVQFNSSVDCSSPGCDLGNASVWNNGVLPSINDTVEIFAPLDGKQYYFTVAVNATYYNFYVQNINLNVVSRLRISNSTSVSNSTIIVFAQSTFSVAIDVLFSKNSKLVILPLGSALGQITPFKPTITFDSSTTLQIEGSFIFYGELCQLNGSLTITPTATIEFYCFPLIYSPYFADVNSLFDTMDIIIPDNSEFTFTAGAITNNMYIGENSNVTIMQQASIWDYASSGTSLFMKDGSNLNILDVYSSPLSLDGITYPTGTTGRINIYSSQVFFIGDNITPSRPIYFYGKNNSANFINSVISNLIFSDDAEIHIAASELVLMNNKSEPNYIPGDISCGAITFLGSFSFAGGLEAVIGSIRSHQSISFGGPVQLYGLPNYYDNTTMSPATWNISGTLTAPQISLYNTSVLRVMGNLQINGNLDNFGGVVQIFASQAVYINGDYNQGDKANISLLGLDANFNTSNFNVNSSARIIVERNVEIAGMVTYTYNDLPKDTKYPILQTLNGTIIGKFAQKATAEAGSIKTLDFNYTDPTIVYVVNTYSPPPPSKGGKLGPLEWYYWVVIGVGALLGLIGTVVACFVARRRTKYSKI